MVGCVNQFVGPGGDVLHTQHDRLASARRVTVVPERIAALVSERADIDAPGLSHFRQGKLSDPGLVPVIVFREGLAFRVLNCEDRDRPEAVDNLPFAFPAIIAVYSCVPNGKFASWNGTSMATPHVAGAVAQLLSATDIQTVEPAKRAFLIQDLLAATVDELGEAGKDQRYGYGRIDVLRAVGYAKYQGYDRES